MMRCTSSATRAMTTSHQQRCTERTAGGVQADVNRNGGHRHRRRRRSHWQERFTSRKPLILARLTKHGLGWQPSWQTSAARAFPSCHRHWREHADKQHPPRDAGPSLCALTPLKDHQTGVHGKVLCMPKFGVFWRSSCSRCMRSAFNRALISGTWPVVSVPRFHTAPSGRAPCASQKMAPPARLGRDACCG